jgi:hypothetical protein
MSSNLYFLKFVASDSLQRTFVLFGAVFNKQKNAVEKFETLVSYSPDLTKINNDYTLRDLTSRIQKFMLEGNYVQNATLSLINTFKNSFSLETYVMELIYYVEFENHDKLVELLKQNLVKILGKSDVSINVKFDAVEKEDLEKSSYANENVVEKPVEPVLSLEDIIPEGAIVAPFTFVLSPVHGVKVDDLKNGDKVLIKFSPEDESANNIINLLSLKDDSGIIRPAPATIVDIRKQPNQIDTIVKLTDGIFAKYTELETSIKVKLATNEPISSTSKKVDEFEISDRENKSPIHGLNLATILTAIILGVLLVAWILTIVFL